MKIYKNDSTGINRKTSKCNIFGVRFMSYDTCNGTITHHIHFWTNTADVYAGEEPDNIKHVVLRTTVDESDTVRLAALFEGSPYTIGRETIDLSNAEIIGTYTK